MKRRKKGLKIRILKVCPKCRNKFSEGGGFVITYGRTHRLILCSVCDAEFFKEVCSIIKDGVKKPEKKEEKPEILDT